MKQLFSHRCSCAEELVLMRMTWIIRVGGGRGGGAAAVVAVVVVVVAALS